MSENDHSFWLDDDPNPLYRARPASSTPKPAPQPTSQRPQRAAPVSARRPVDVIGTRPMSRVAPPAPIQQSSPTESVIHVKLSVPKAPKFLKPRTYTTATKKVLSNRKLQVVGVLIVLAGGGLFIKNNLLNKSEDGYSGNPTQTSVQIAQKAGINPLVPTSKNGQTATLNSVYDKSKQVYAFEDNYNGAKFTVSEQTLPDSVKKDGSTIKKAAESVNAKKTLDTTKGTIYLATDNKYSTQMAVLQTKTQLVFIKSSAILEDYFWVKYVNDLKFAS